MNVYIDEFGFTDYIIDNKRKQLLYYALSENQYYIEKSNIDIFTEDTRNRDIISKSWDIMKELKKELFSAKKCLIKNKDKKAAKNHYKKSIDMLNELDDYLVNLDDISKESNIKAFIATLLLKIPQILVSSFISEKIDDMNFNKFKHDIESIENDYVKFNMVDVKKVSKYKIGNIPIGKKEYEFGINAIGKSGNELQDQANADFLQNTQVNRKVDNYKARMDLIANINLIKTGINLYKSFSKQSNMLEDDLNRGVYIKNSNAIVGKLRSYIFDLKKYIVKQMNKLN